MIKATLPQDEQERLQALYAYDILDTEAEKVFDDLTLLASEICDTPIALISLVDPERQWFKAAVGLDAQETHRDFAFCAHAICQRDVFEIPDTFNDERFFDNPLVTGDPKIRFYAGAQLVTPDGYALGTLCAISDKPKVLTDQQRNALEILSREVISQLELRQKLKALELASQYKTDFLSNMSHEVRNPINGVLGSLYLLKDSELNTAQSHLTDLSINGAESLLGIVSNVLDIAKIEAGKIELEETPFDLLELLGEIAQSLSVKAEEKEIELVCPDHYLQDSLVIGDPLRLRQVLVNLLGNGIKFTEHGQIRVSVYPEMMDGDKVQMRFEVRDSGIGMTQSQMDNLFQRFVQAETSTCRQYGGSGLGLNIAKQLVESMGGEIGIESEPGKGSLFWFTLALCYQEQAERDSSHVQDSFRILVLHGSQEYRCLLAETLNAWDLNHDVVESSEEALMLLHHAAVKESPYHLVLIDEHSEPKDGLSLSQLVTQDSLLPSVKFVLLSHPMQLKPEAFYQQYDAVVSHPIVLSDLKTSVYDLLEPLEKAVEANAQARSDRFNARVLVVDDSETNRIVAQGVLQKFVREVDVANDGEQAISLLKKRHYDLVFMDCQMPVMDGYEATRKLRQMTSGLTHASVPVIALSGSTITGEDERCLAAGMDAFLLKPIDPMILKDCLQQWLVQSFQERASEVDNTSSVALAVFDHDQFSKRLVHDHGLIEVTLGIVMKDLPEQLHLLKTCHKSGDSDKLRHQLHRIKGVAANTSALALAELCRVLEACMMSGLSDELTFKLPELEQAISDFIQQAEEFLLKQRI